MTDTSKYDRELAYLYGRYDSPLDKKIKNTEKILNQQKQIQEDNLEAQFDRENLERLKKMKVSDMSWRDIELFNKIRKGDVDKVYVEDSGPAPDIKALKSQIVSNLNEFIPLGGVALSPISEGASLPDILAFCNAFIDALKNKAKPAPETGEPEQLIVNGSKATITKGKDSVTYTRDELLATKAEIEKLLKQLDR